MEFIANLHVHSDISLHDALANIHDIVTKAKKLNWKAVALTDHGTCSGLFQFYKECNKQDIKPLLGCEMYFVHDINLKESPMYHMLLLAKDYAGYKNLMKLNSYAHEHYYKKPRIDVQAIEEFHDGLICSTACLAGIMRQDDPAEDMYQLYDLFGSDLYCELQPHPTPEQREYNHKVYDFAVQHDHKTIITLDSHYVDKEDARYHRYWLNLGKESDYYSTPTYYMMSTQEINKYMTEYHEFTQKQINVCYANIQEIVDKCNVEIPTGEQHYPNFCDDPEGYIRKRCNEGYKEKGVSKWANKKEHIDRIQYEINMLKKVNYLNYLCIIDDMTHWCNKNGIRIGLGRGSCVSSDVMYLMGCTKVDPIKYNLLFERFCNPERTSSADVDTDVQASRRDDLIEYIKAKYGEVYQVRTFGYIKPASACRRACQALGYDSTKTNEISKGIESVDDIVDKDVKDIALHFLGHIINFSTHASAVIVCPDDINNYTSIERQKNTKTGEYDYMVCYEYHDCEAMGLLKLDILGLQHLDIIDRVVKQTGIDYDAIPDVDEKTSIMINQGKTEGVFQGESQGFTSLLQQLHTKEAYDFIVSNALYRPGSLDSGTTQEYILRRNGKHEVSYPVPELEPALKDTMGLVVYQEQIMTGARILCGYSLGQADNVRRIIGRKIHEEMEPCVKDMRIAAEKLGTPQDAIDEFVKVVLAAANYSFNKSHAAAYGITAWRSAYLKANYPLEYMASFLNQKHKSDKFPMYIKAAKDMGITIKHPELGLAECTKVGNAIQLGTNCIKGVGNIDQPVSKSNILSVMEQYNSNTLESLISGGALDYFKEPRAKLVGSIKGIKEYYKNLNSYHLAIERWKDNTKHKPEYIASKIAYYEVKIKNTKVTWPTDPTFDEIAAEMKVLGFTFQDPLKNYDITLVNNRTTFAGFINRFKKIRDKKGRIMAFIDLDNGLNFTMFSRQYKELEEGKPYLIGAVKNTKGYIVDSVQPLRRVN